MLENILRFQVLTSGSKYLAVTHISTHFEHHNKGEEREGKGGGGEVVVYHKVTTRMNE